jgi:uncharacterized membrane protein
LLSRAILNVFEPVTNWLWANWGYDIDGLPHQIILINIGFSWLLAFVAIYLVGFFSALVFVRRLIYVGEAILVRIPIIKTVYGTIKQIVETFSAGGAGSFQKVVIIEFPRPGIFSVAFVTGESHLEGDPRRYVNVFLPTTPNVTTGFLLVLPSEEVRETFLTIEEAFKFIISGGILTFPSLRTRPYRPLRPEEISIMEPPKAAPAANAPSDVSKAPPSMEPKN